jgi:hypothetical protein
MSANEFVTRVLNVWPHLKDDVSFGAFAHDIEEKQNQGWEFKDVLSYLRTFEEVSPIPDDADEKEAMRLEAMYLERRARIEAKYLDGNVELYEVRFSSLAPLNSR